MRAGWWWILAAIAAAALSGGYYIVTNRMTGPRWDRMTPEMRSKVQQLLELAQARGLRVMFWDGWRSPEDSAKNIAAGTSRVSDPLNSLHVWGIAADIVPVNAAGLPEWPPETDPRWRQLAELGRSIGLVSGGLSWGWDWPHFQLPGYTAGQLRAQYGNNYFSFLQSRGISVA